MAPRRALNALFRIGAAILTGLGLLVLIVSATPLVSWWARGLAGPWNNPSGDVLVVLAGDASDEGAMGRSTYIRSLYAYDAYQRHEVRRIVLSGGPSRMPAAAAMRDYLRYRGVPAEAISIETRSTSTRENALFTKPLLDALPGSKVLMTSDFHMARAIGTFRRLGVRIAPRPVPDALKQATSPADRWSAFLELTRETAALIVYRLRGWM